MSDNHSTISDFIGSDVLLDFRCRNYGLYYAHHEPPLCSYTAKLTPEDVIERYGDRRLSALGWLRCPHCRGDLSYRGLIRRRADISQAEEAFYEERIQTDYFIKFAILALSILIVFSLSAILPNQMVFILSASLLTSATLIVLFLVLFMFVTKFKQAVIEFERNIKVFTLSFLFVCLSVSILALITLAFL